MIGMIKSAKKDTENGTALPPPPPAPSSLVQVRTTLNTTVYNRFLFVQCFGYGSAWPFFCVFAAPRELIFLKGGWGLLVQPILAHAFIC